MVGWVDKDHMRKTTLLNVVYARKELDACRILRDLAMSKIPLDEQTIYECDIDIEHHESRLVVNQAQWIDIIIGDMIEI